MIANLTLNYEKIWFWRKVNNNKKFLGKNYLDIRKCD